MAPERGLTIAERTATKTHTRFSVFHTPAWDRVRNGQDTSAHEDNMEAFRKFCVEQGFKAEGNFYHIKVTKA